MSDEMMIVEQETAIANSGETFADRIINQVREAGFYATFDTSSAPAK